MRLVKDQYGKKKGRKSVNVVVKKQNSSEKMRSLSLQLTNTEQVYGMIERFFESIEEQVAVIDVIKHLRLVEDCLDDPAEAKGLINQFIKKLGG